MQILIYLLGEHMFVQAALGPIALDLARKLNSDEHIRLANAVLVVSVLAIVLTAPLGAVLMIRLAPVWLQRQLPAAVPCTRHDDINTATETAADASDDGTLHVVCSTILCKCGDVTYEHVT